MLILKNQKQIKRSDERARAALKRRDESMERLRVKMTEFANRIAQLDDLKTLHDEILELSKILYVSNEISRSRRLPAFNLGRLHVDQQHARVQAALIRLFGVRLTEQRGFVDKHLQFDIRQQTKQGLESIS